MSGLIKGLEGVVALQSAISSIIDEKLTYRGVPFDELVGRASFEEVVYLLWNGDLPDEGELGEFKGDLADNRALPEHLLEELPAYPRDGAPMDAVRTGLSSLALADPEVGPPSPEANRRKSIRLVARLPMIMTSFHRLRHGHQPIPPRPDLSTAGNILYTMTGKEPTPVFTQAMDEALVVYADHELNASTFTARIVASTLSDIYGAVTAAIAALKGSLHGGANQAVAQMLREINNVQSVEPYVRAKLAAHGRVMGFGHRVYRQGDPRTKHLRALAKRLSDLTGDRKWYEIAIKLEGVVEREKNIPANVDFYSAIVYHLMGFPDDLFPVLFACGRVAGWCAHVVEQYQDNRLIRPRAEYTGPAMRPFVPLEQRRPPTERAAGAEGA